jgi:hypothetical protein
MEAFRIVEKLSFFFGSEPPRALGQSLFHESPATSRDLLRHKPLPPVEAKVEGMDLGIDNGPDKTFFLLDEKRRRPILLEEDSIEVL